MILTGKSLTKLPSDISNYSSIDLVGSPKVVDDFNCSNNKLTSLFGGPEIVNNTFDCVNNYLKTLEHGPSKCGVLDCENNKLTSLLGVSKHIQSHFFCSKNAKLIDISNIWDSKIVGIVFIDLNVNMAILPLVKFISVITNNEPIEEILSKHLGDRKQNIIDCQYDLIENGFEEHARWKP